MSTASKGKFGGFKTSFMMSSGWAIAKFSVLRPQQTANQNDLEAGQLKKRWLKDSMLSLQKRQLASLTMRRVSRFSFVGRELTPILQRSIFSISGRFKFQNLFQKIPLGSKEGRWERDT